MDHNSNSLIFFFFLEDLKQFEPTGREQIPQVKEPDKSFIHLLTLSCTSYRLFPPFPTEVRISLKSKKHKSMTDMMALQIC